MLHDIGYINNIANIIILKFRDLFLIPKAIPESDWIKWVSLKCNSRVYIAIWLINIPKTFNSAGRRKGISYAQ